MLGARNTQKNETALPFRQLLASWQELRQQMDIGALMETVGCSRENRVVGHLLVMESKQG